MTVLAGYIDRRTGRVAIGADQQSETNGARFLRSTKLFDHGAAIVAFAGTGLHERFLRVAPPLTCEADLPAFADAWVEWARARGLGVNEGGDLLMNASILVALPGCIRGIGSDGGVFGGDNPAQPYVALGSGEAVARGALWAAHAWRSPPEAAVRVAVEAAITHAHGCGGASVVRIIEPEPG